MATLVKARDGGCRFPGCTTTLRFCDLDHVTPWPAGTTAASNLIALCRRHHRIKQTHGWSVRLDPDGTTTWTDPAGRTRTTHPQDLRGPELPAVAQVPVDPDDVVTDHPTATGLTGNWSDLEEELELVLAVVEHQHAEADRKAARCSPDATTTASTAPTRCTTSHHHDRGPERSRASSSSHRQGTGP
jgi:hypothetical protein